MWLAQLTGAVVRPGEREAALCSPGRLELLPAGIAPGAAQRGPGHAQQSHLGHPQVLLPTPAPLQCLLQLPFKCRLLHFVLAVFILKLL